MKPGALLILALAVCAGCRSDGGVGREDSARGMEFSCNTVATRYRYDIKRSQYLISSIPSAFSDACDAGWRNFRNTYYLYIENHGTE